MATCHRSRKVPLDSTASSKNRPGVSLCPDLVCCSVQLPGPWFLARSLFFPTPHQVCCPSRASSAVSILPPALIFLLPPAHSASRPLSLLPLPALLVPSLAPLLLSLSPWSASCPCRFCLHLSAPLPAPRSAQTPRRTAPAAVLCSRDTAGSSVAPAPPAYRAWHRRLGPRAAAAAAAAREARPAQPHSAVPAPHGALRNGGSAGREPAGSAASLPCHTRQAASGAPQAVWDAGARAGDEPASSTMPRSGLRQRLGV